MTDTVSPEKRSWIMSRVRGKDTRPERAVRSLAHRFGYRFRLHRSDLPGSPDMVFPSRRKVVFVHGCFWHGHDCRRGDRMPKGNRPYWREKIGRNRERDARNTGRLRELGWEVLVLWTCQLRDEAKLADRLVRFLGKPGSARLHA